MASLVPAPAVVAEAERLVSILRSHSGSPADQAKAVRQLDKLRCVLHTGSDALMFQALPFQVLPALNVLSDFRVFDVVPLNGSISVEALAAEVKLDPTILSRFIHIVLTQGVFREISPGLYEHTSASAIFRSDQAASFFRLGTMQFPNWWKVSDYLKTHSARDAQEATRVPYVWAHGGEGSMTYFDAIEAEPTVAAAWHDGMTMIETMQPVGGMFPFPSVRAAVEAEPHRAFIVDVGGGRGNALVSIMRECGSSYGAPMVLQDMAEVLEGEDPVRIDGVRNMPHNFYDVQPVKNAHIYYLRNVLHNHYDERSRTILRRIVDAMGPTSRVLIGEMILPGTAAPGADPFPFFMDLNMFMEGGIERTEEHWGRLLGEVGLQIEKIWRHPDNPVQSTIEARIQK